MGWALPLEDEIVSCQWMVEVVLCELRVHNDSNGLKCSRYKIMRAIWGDYKFNFQMQILANYCQGLSFSIKGHFG